MKVAVLASGGPDRHDGGGVFLGQVLTSLADHDVRMVRVDVGDAGRPRGVPGQVPTLAVPVRGPVRGLGRARALNRRAADRIEWSVIREVQLRRAARAIGRTLVEFEPDVLLCVLSSLETILLAQRLLRGRRVRFVTMEWDPPVSMEHVLDVPRFALRRILRTQEEIVRRAGGVAVTSEGMAATYQRKFGRSAKILRQYVDQEILPAESETSQSHKEWLIYLAGTVYATREFEVFLAALDLCGWVLHGRPIRLRWLGNGSLAETGGARRIDRLSWQPFERAVALGVGCDLGYVGYWFDPARSAETENCFPSKMISYIGAGVPPFFHGPATAGPALFLQRFGAGFVCTEESPQGVLDALQAALGDPARHARWRLACREVARREFSPRTFKERLLSVLEGSTARPSPAFAESG